MAETISRAPYIALVIVALLVAGIGGAYLYETQRVTPLAPARLAQVGDNVTVNYIGLFGSGPQAGRVFDTSIYAVAQNNITYPKSLEYHARGGPSNYTPLDVHVGGSTPRSGYSLGGHTFIQVVTGFWQGLIGLSGNQTRSVNVPPDLGYGPLNTTCLSVRPLTQTIPIFKTLPASQFSTDYPGESSTIGSVFADPHYKWPVQVYSSNSSFVTVENLPSVGWTADPAGWSVLVTNVTGTANGTGQITLVNVLTSADVGHVLGHDFAGLTNPCATSASASFLIWAVDPVAGNYTANYNTEVTGETLIFIVTLVDIFLPA